MFSGNVNYSILQFWFCIPVFSFLRKLYITWDYTPLTMKWQLINVKSKRIWSYQRVHRCNQNPYIEEGQTTQWPKEKYKRTNNDLQNIHIKLDRATRTQLQTGGELRCSVRVSSSCSTSDTRRFKLHQRWMVMKELVYSRPYYVWGAYFIRPMQMKELITHLLSTLLWGAYFIRPMY